MTVDPTDINTINIDPTDFEAPIENNKKEQISSNITKDTQSSFVNDMEDYFDVFGAAIIGGVSFGLFEAYRRKHRRNIPTPPPPPVTSTQNISRRFNRPSPTRSEEKRSASSTPLEKKCRDEYENKIRKMIGILFQSDYWKPTKALNLKRQGDELRALGNPFLFLQVICQDDTVSMQMETILGKGWGNIARRTPFISNMKSEIDQLANPSSYIDLLSEASDKSKEELRPFFENRNWEGLLDYLFLS